eukprot:12621849-Ditylum_brightwellii.AAC.1
MKLLPATKQPGNLMPIMMTMIVVFSGHRNSGSNGNNQQWQQWQQSTVVTVAAAAAAVPINSGACSSGYINNQ